MHYLRQWNSMMFSMWHCLRSMLNMLIMWSTSLYCKWNHMENLSKSLTVYCSKRCSFSQTKKSSKLKCNGITLGPMKLHWIWQIRCRLCILPYFPVEAKYLLVWCFGTCLWYMFWYLFDDFLVYVHMYMFVNTSMSYVIKL